MWNMPSHQENLTVLAQFEDRQRATANGWGETLPSGMCHRLPTTKVLSCTYTVVSPCGVGRGLCSSRQVSPGSTWLSPVISRPRPNECLRRYAAPLPSPDGQVRQIGFSFLTEEDSGRCSPKSFPPLYNPLILWPIHSSIQQGLWEPPISLTLWPVLNFFFHSFVQQYLLTAYYTPGIAMCKNVQKWIKSPHP